MKTRTAKAKSETPIELEDETPSTATQFSAGPSSELWVLDGFDDGVAPYEIDLPHPRTGRLTAFAILLKNGSATVGEIRSFTSDKPASFLTVVGNEAGAGEDANTDNKAIISRQDLRYVSEIDPVFLLLPILAPPRPTSNKNREGRGVFVQFDDLMDSWKEQSEHVSKIVEPGYTFESQASTSLFMVDSLQSALGRCCDTVEAGDETMYRFSEDKFFQLILSKAQRMVAAGLPPSLEDMAARAVEPPAGVVLEKQGDAEAESTGTPGPGESEESQASKASSIFSQEQSTIDTHATDSQATSAPAASSTFLDLMRLRLAFDLILCNYVPPPLSKTILARLDRDGGNGDIVFTPLRGRIKEIKEKKDELVQAQSLNYSRKRVLDDERVEEMAEKRRKREEEEKKRKSESVATKQLRKVDTSGMKKMSAFFTARPKAK